MVGVQWNRGGCAKDRMNCQQHGYDDVSDIEFLSSDARALFFVV